MNTQSQTTTANNEANEASRCLITKIVETMEKTHGRMVSMAGSMDNLHGRLAAEQSRLLPREDLMDALRTEAKEILAGIEKVQCEEFIHLQCLVAEALEQGASASSIVQKLATLAAGRDDMLAATGQEPTWKNERSAVSPWA